MSCEGFSHIRAELVANKDSGLPTCDLCGRQLLPTIDGHSYELKCPEHGCRLVTSYFPPVERDATSYSIWLEAGSVSEMPAVKAVAKLASCNYLQAKKLIDASHRSKIYEGNALDVIHAMRLLDDAEVDYSIEPGFPYARKGLSMYDWVPADGAADVEDDGNKDGEILADEELAGVARVTLERCDEFCLIIYDVLDNERGAVYCDRDQPFGVYEVVKQELGAFVAGEAPGSEEPDFCRELGFHAGGGHD